MSTIIIENIVLKQKQIISIFAGHSLSSLLYLFENFPRLSVRYACYLALASQLLFGGEIFNKNPIFFETPRDFNVPRTSYCS